MKCHNTQFNAMNRISFQIITIKRAKMLVVDRSMNYVIMSMISAEDKSFHSIAWVMSKKNCVSMTEKTWSSTLLFNRRSDGSFIVALLHYFVVIPISHKYKYQWVDIRREGLSISVWHIDQNHIRLLILQLELINLPKLEKNKEEKTTKHNKTLNEMNLF